MYNILYNYIILYSTYFSQCCAFVHLTDDDVQRWGRLDEQDLGGELANVKSEMPLIYLCGNMKQGGTV